MSNEKFLPEGTKKIVVKDQEGNTLKDYEKSNKEDLSEDFLPHDTVGAIIKNDNGEILMLYHNKYELYSIPVGKVKDDDSSAFESVEREILEELGIQCTNIEYVTSAKINYTLKNKQLDSDGLLFNILSYKGVITNKEPDKHSQLTFMSIEQIKCLRSQDKLTELTKVYLDTLNKIN